MTKPLLKTPISYYGGKQTLLSEILPLIPEHHTYVEPFFGGGAVFFGKPQSKAEVVNDTNSNLINFYKVLKYDFESLKEKIDESFHSRLQHRESLNVYEDEECIDKDKIQAAWSVWMQTNMSFSCMIGAGFGYDKLGKVALKIGNKKEKFTELFQQRMKRVTIENYDVLKVVKAYDSPDAFFYFDPPYVSANQGHYGGYTLDDFKNLLDACANLKGKFLLSSYPEPILMEYRKKFGWKSKDIEKTLAVDGRRKATKKKIECLTWNY
ncbi:DNA adenine methylase [Flectobacillus sp. BAB-3569]|uniref:DNA adenine methylase n=1 Tax=Flectobacillus sp. BAB-3569 TaxID=1509483 RepID=UPI000BA3866B|nr:DNA adenine methylase [Flectobacillus sp. BAB-3569]PAC27770.1 methyltransferase [Flectobacillus sp. BAB-3569]